MNQTWKNDKKINFVPDFGLFGPNWSPKKIFVIFTSSRCIAASLYVISRKTNEPNLRKWQKNEFCVRFWLLCPNSGRQFFFFLKKKNAAPSFTRYRGHLSSCTISEKTNDSILRKLSGRRTDGQTEIRTI